MFGAVVVDITFTLETKTDDRPPFLDVQTIRDQETQTLRTEVFRKPTHTDRYLHYKSYSVFDCSDESGTCPRLLSHSPSGHMCQRIITTMWACLLQFRWRLPQRIPCICWLQLGIVEIPWQPRLVGRTFLHTGSMLSSGRTQRASVCCLY